MSWHYLQEPGGAFSVDSYLDGVRSQRASLSPTRESACLRDSETDSLTASRYGTMCAPSTANRGEGWLMLSAGDFPAKTLAQQEKGQESRAREADCGKRCAESFARYDRDTRSWRTAQCSLLEGLELYSETWPKQGTMRNGWCWEQPTSELRTSGTESGFLRKIGRNVWLSTPTCTMSERSQQFQGVNKLPTPKEFVKKWGNTPRHLIPTPTACNAPNKGANTKGPKSLLEVAQTGWNPGEPWEGRMFPTPLSHNAKELTPCPSNKNRKTPGLGTLAAYGALGAPGRLNPAWVEWLMGWPVGWTDCEPLAMDKYRLWQQQHSLN